MNNRGQVGISIIVAITIFIAGMLFVNFLKPEVTNARDETIGLNCGNASAISDGTKLTCLAIDWVVPYFMIVVMAAAGGVITEKFVKGKG